MQPIGGELKTFQIGLTWSSSASGGAERIFSELAFGLPQVGVGFIGAVAGETDLDSKTAGLVHGFASEKSGTLTRLAGARRAMNRLLDEQRPDLLASHFALYTLPVWKRLKERPFIMHFHGPWALESAIEGAAAHSVFAKRQLERLTYGRADRIIVLSRAFALLLQEQYGIAPEKIRIIPGAVDLDRFNVASSPVDARKLLAWPEDRPILFSVRRFVHRMGLQQLVQAMPAVIKRVPDVLCFLAGTGPIRAELEKRVEELNLTKNIRFLGFLSEELLPYAYRAATLSVVPTVALEGFGLVAAESLAAGTPAMVTPVGGLPEIVEGLSNNLLFRSSESTDLADGLISALLGTSYIPNEQECRKHAEEMFSRNLMVSRVASVYKE